MKHTDYPRGRDGSTSRPPEMEGLSVRACRRVWVASSEKPRKLESRKDAQKKHCLMCSFASFGVSLQGPSEAPPLDASREVFFVSTAAPISETGTRCDIISRHEDAHLGKRGGVQEYRCR